MAHPTSLAARAGWKEHEALQHLLGEFWEPRGTSPWLNATEDDYVEAWNACTSHVELIGLTARFGDRSALFGVLLDCATEHVATLPGDSKAVRETLDVARKLLAGEKVSKATLTRAQKPSYRGSDEVYDASGAAAALLGAVQSRKRRKPTDKEPLEGAGCGEEVAARVKAAVSPPPWKAVHRALCAVKKQIETDDEPVDEPEPTEADVEWEREAKARADKQAEEFANPSASAFEKAIVVFASESMVLLKHPKGQWPIRATNTGLKKGDEVMAASLLGTRIDWVWLGVGEARRCVRFDGHGEPVTET